MYELPTCPVCLERMDSAVTGLVTVPCSHTFHCMCLSKWGDSRYVASMELSTCLTTFISGVPFADILRTYFLLVLPHPPRAPLFRSRLLTLQRHRCLPVLPALRRPTCGSALFVATSVVVGTGAHMRSLIIKQQRIYMHWSLKHRGFGTMLATDMCTGLSKTNRMASWLNCLA